MDKVIREGAVRVGVDLAKHVIQVHAVDATGRVLRTKPLARAKLIEWCVRLPRGCLVAMEASSSAHHWARKLAALGLDPRIISAQLVEPYRSQGASGKDNDAVKTAATLLGIGPVTASAVVATVGDFKQFKNGAQFGAWIGLTPRQRSSGGKNNLGGITKRGDTYLRTLLIQRAKSAVMTAHRRQDPPRDIVQLEDRRAMDQAVDGGYRRAGVGE